MEINPSDFYKKLFSDIESRYGALDNETVTSLIGFTAGGSVSVSTIESKSLYVTCELALNPNQTPSAEGLNFELASCGTFDLDQCREVFTALGDLSLGCELGNGHTIGVSGAFDGTVSLSLISRSDIEGHAYGIYMVEPVID